MNAQTPPPSSPTWFARNTAEKPTVYLHSAASSAQLSALAGQTAQPRTSYVEQSLAGHAGPVVIATDHMKIFADQIRPFVPDRRFVVLAALKALADDGLISRTKVAEAMTRYGIDVDKVNPVAV